MTQTQTAPTKSSLCQTILLDYEAEITSTRKLLQLVPLDDAHRDYKPHAKSMALDRLASHVAELPGWAKFALETEELAFDATTFKPTFAQSTEELLRMFEKSAQEGREAIAAATDEDMQKTWTFKWNGQAVYSDIRTQVVRNFLNHLIHHRAQLGVYLRLNGIPIPGMYGPSADETM